MKLEVGKFYRACNPGPLDMGKAEDQRYYIDFSSARGSDVIGELERTITRLSPAQPTCQLFTGHIGSGKSTELQRLKAKLEQEKFHVVYFESNQDIDRVDVDVTDILLAIARSVSASLEAINIRIRSAYLVNLLREIDNILPTQIEINQVEFSLAIAEISASSKGSYRLRSQLRQYLEPRTNRILEAINLELLEPAIEKLKGVGKKGLVVIVDNLDRLDYSVKPTGRIQPEYLFVDRGEQLKQLNCHLLYTVPLMLIFSKALSRLRDVFGVEPKVLPMVPVQLRLGGEYLQGMELLQQMIVVRAFPEAKEDERIDLITDVFDSRETLKRLCQISGGHVRNLLSLLLRCLQKDDPPLSRHCIESVIRQRRNELILPLTDEEKNFLRQVRQHKSLMGEDRYQEMVNGMFIFEYRDRDGSWFDINPILSEAREFQLSDK